jgi:hypothetical protein
VGRSVGGILATQTGFTQSYGFIRAVIVTYPGPGIGIKLEEAIFVFPTVPTHVAEERLKKLKKKKKKTGEITTPANPPARMPIALSLVQQIKTRELFGEGDGL